MVTLFLSSPLAMSMDGCEEITLLTYKNVFIYKNRRQLVRGHGATVARLIPDQKVGCSNHPVLNFSFSWFLLFVQDSCFENTYQMDDKKRVHEDSEGKTSDIPSNQSVLV